MQIIKYILFLILISFSYQINHCRYGYKYCNNMNNPKIPNCIYGDDEICIACKDNYSLSNDRTKCINIPNCALFDEDNEEEEKCITCKKYYNFNEEKKCVVDYCGSYGNDDGKCIACYDGFYVNDNGKCERISIPYCLQLTPNDKDKCLYCALGTILKDGECKERNYLEGCINYNEDGTCKECVSVFYSLNDKKECTFQNICGYYPISDYCSLCENGYYVDIYTHQCIAYDGSKDNESSSKNINIHFGLIALLFMIIF